MYRTLKFQNVIYVIIYYNIEQILYSVMVPESLEKTLQNLEIPEFIEVYKSENL